VRECNRSICLHVGQLACCFLLTFHIGISASTATGIQCYNRLEDMLKLVDVQVVQKESKYVVQKYIGKTSVVSSINCHLSVGTDQVTARQLLICSSFFFVFFIFEAHFCRNLTHF